MDLRIPVFLCGEPLRGDDAAAFLAAGRLAPAVQAHARLVHAGQLDVQLLLELPPDLPCIVVDAVAGMLPGTLLTVPLQRIAGAARDRAQRAGLPAARSSHRLPLDQTLALAALLRDAPLHGTFLGLSGSCFDLGAAPSPAVAAALPALTEAIAAESERLAALEICAC